MKSFIYFITILIVCTSLCARAQSTSGKILLISDSDAEVLVDGDKQGSTTAGNAFKIELLAGEHYIQIQCIQNGKTINTGTTVNVEAGKQTILNLSLPSETPSTFVASGSNDTITISNVDFIISGGIVVGSWMNDHPEQTYPDYPVYYYVFDKGDILLMDFRMDNKKGTNVFMVSNYADGSVIYTDNNLVSAKNLAIKIPTKGIYVVSFATNHILDRSCNMFLKKIPSSTESKALSPSVGWKTVNDTIFDTRTENTLVSTTYKAVHVQDPMKQWVNSGSNATFLGGKSRVVVPVNLPANTVEWYYIVSANRDEAQMNGTMSGFKLLTDVTNAIDATGVAGFGISLLTKPPGADYCDVYLLDYQSQTLFLNKEEGWKYNIEGTRENVASGLVKVKGITSGQVYLGIRNPNTSYGEFVAIEVVAVTKEEKYEIQQVKTIKRIDVKKIPLMQG
ncbi:MAG: hypothetical protein ABIS12_18015 [Bacteroidia bacterium]